jgi:RNA polymerase sigma-70 factor (ECF subfamily)
MSVQGASQGWEDADVLVAARVRPELLGILFERHAVAVHRFLAWRVGSEAADDLLGDVFVAAVEARLRVQAHESGSALPWLYGISRNVVRAHLRRRAPILGWPADDECDWAAVDARVDALGRRQELRAVMAALSDHERQVLLLVAWDGLSPVEAARALGITPEASRTRLRRARLRAQQVLSVAPVHTEGEGSWT